VKEGSVTKVQFKTADNKKVGFSIIKNPT